MSLLSEEKVEPLADGVLEVLYSVGVLCQNERMLSALAEAGAEVDGSTERVRFPREMTSEFVDRLRDEQTEGSRTGHELQAPSLPSVSTQVAQLYCDHRSGEERSSNSEDLITAVKFGDALHRQRGVGHALSLTDVPPMVEPLHAGMVLGEYAHNPHGPFAWHVDQIPYLREMGQILGIDDWFGWGAICFAHPLRFDRDTANKFVARVEAGVRTGWTAMPVAGLTTPVTVEGFVVVSSAEHIATWMAARAINPDVPLSGSMWSGSVDMATGSVSYSAPDALFYGFASVEFLQRWCGRSIPVGGADYCDARRPGLYAALEKAHKAVTIAAFTGRGLCTGSGMVSEGKTLSLTQLLLDREMAEAMAHLVGDINPTADNIAMDTIKQVGVGLDGNYLESEHTLRQFREATWLPDLIDRAGWDGFDHEQQVLQEAAARVDDLLSAYEKPQGRRRQLQQMEDVLRRAEDELL